MHSWTFSFIITTWHKFCFTAYFFFDSSMSTTHIRLNYKHYLGLMNKNKFPFHIISSVNIVIFKCLLFVLLGGIRQVLLRCILKNLQVILILDPNALYHIFNSSMKCDAGVRLWLALLSFFGHSTYY